MASGAEPRLNYYWRIAVAIALFDLDNTLIAGDSDCLWGEYLVSCGAVDDQQFAAAHRQFHEQYVQGNLDIDSFLEFALRPLAENSIDDLLKWREDFMRSLIEPIVLPAAERLIESHRSAGDHLAIVTATNSFVTTPIAQRLGINSLMATEPEVVNGHYSGRYTGTPTFQEGKIAAVNKWLQNNELTNLSCYFYSDSLNDIPLLESVEHPIAVDPDEKLADVASKRGWRILTLRAGEQPEDINY
nr:HAD family hydrolase [Halorhodospira halochloris]